MTYHDLARKLNDVPFKPFRIKLSNATTIDVHEPVPVILGELSAVVPVKMIVDDRGVRVARDWKTIAIRHIVEFTDLKEDQRLKRKRA